MGETEKKYILCIWDILIYIYNKNIRERSSGNFLGQDKLIFEEDTTLMIFSCKNMSTKHKLNDLL